MIFPNVGHRVFFQKARQSVIQNLQLCRPPVAIEKCLAEFPSALAPSLTYRSCPGKLYLQNLGFNFGKVFITLAKFTCLTILDMSEYLCSDFNKGSYAHMSLWLIDYQLSSAHVSKLFRDNFDITMGRAEIFLLALFSSSLVTKVFKCSIFSKCHFTCFFDFPFLDQLSF